MISPIERLLRLSDTLNIDLRVKRDDLLPASGGGNKVRKVHRIISEAASLGYDAIITHGGTQSNHARVSALLASEKGWTCKLILHGNPEAMANPKGNLLLMKLAGADIVIVPGAQLAEAITKGIEELKSVGQKPFSIPGGGHCLHGTLAYADAVTEIAEQLKAEKWTPNTIVVASGTGATQAGILVGVKRLGWSTRVIGVSVGRFRIRGSTAVSDALREACAVLGLSVGEDGVEFRDEWLCGGYELASVRVLDVVRHVARCCGLILDPTYTAKAFTALLDLVENGEIERGSRVLFWHTGGLLNLLSSPYFTQ